MAPMITKLYLQVDWALAPFHSNRFLPSPERYLSVVCPSSATNPRELKHSGTTQWSPATSICHTASWADELTVRHSFHMERNRAAWLLGIASATADRNQSLSYMSQALKALRATRCNTRQTSSMQSLSLLGARLYQWSYWSQTYARYLPFVPHYAPWLTDCSDTSQDALSYWAALNNTDCEQLIYIQN